MRLIILIFCGSFVLCFGEDCNFVINEINSHKPGSFGKANFLEFVSFCSGALKSIPLQGYKVIGISTGTAHSNEMSIELVVNLWNARTNSAGMITIGGPDVPLADLKVPSPYVHFRNEFQRNTQNIFTFLNTGNKHLHAVVVLFKANDALSDISLTAKKPFIKLTDHYKDLIRANIVDMIVYGRRAAFDSCKLFSDLFPNYENRKYVLREIDDDDHDIDYTLNRCALETNGFIPEKFKLGKPTPAEVNDCSGGHFILEDHLLEVTNPIQNVGYAEEDEDILEQTELNDDTAQCSTGQTSSLYFSSRTSRISEEVSRIMIAAESDQCNALNLNPNGASTSNQMSTENQRKRRISGEADYSEDLEWSTTKNFE